MSSILDVMDLWFYQGREGRQGVEGLLTRYRQNRFFLLNWKLPEYCLLNICLLLKSTSRMLFIYNFKDNVTCKNLFCWNVGINFQASFIAFMADGLLWVRTNKLVRINRILVWGRKKKKKKKYLYGCHVTASAGKAGLHEGTAVLCVLLRKVGDRQ